MSADAALGVGEFTDRNGKLWKLARPNFETELEYTAFLERRALAAVRRHAHAAGLNANALAAEVVKDISAGVYAWQGDAWVKSMNNVDCRRELAFWMARQLEARVQRQDVESVWDHAFEDKMAEMIMAPNFTAPATTEAAGAS